MFRACRPEVCKKVYRSDHSFSFDEDEATRYTAVAAEVLPAPRGPRPQAPTAGLAQPARAAGGAKAPAAERQEPRPALGGVFAACAKPCLAADDVEAAHEVYPSAEGGYGRGGTGLHVNSSADEDPGYRLLEAGDSADEEEFAQRTRGFVRQFSGVNRTVNTLQSAVAVLLVVACLLTASLCAVAYQQMIPEHQYQAREVAMLASIPIVACLFTWFHIWMAIQMMFRPLNFVGLYNHGGTGMGLGWQGVVPRKAERMASMGYTCARPYIQGPGEIMAGVNPRALVAKVRPQLVQVIERALAQVGTEHYPWIDRQMGANGKKKIAEASVDRIVEGCPELWKKYMGLLADRQHGIDNDGMFVKIFTENKVLLNNFFLFLGEKEFKFIEHCGAMMGFVCGLIQLVAFDQLSGTTRVIFLPATGFVLGIFSNWLAIQMVFKPAYPIPVRIFGWHIYDIQGLFLKRQKDVCVLYSKMVVDNFLNFEKIVEYLMSQPVLWAKLKAAYLAFNTAVMKESMGVLATWLAPLALGQQSFADLEDSMRLALVEGLYDAKDIHKAAGKYVSKVTNLERKTCVSLQGMPPDEFENLLHPIFKEDEWILVLLGGVLGVLVGIGQIYFLS